MVPRHVRPAKSSVSRSRASLHLAVLFGFAVAQPLYDLLGDNPAFFVYRRFGAVELVLFTLLVSILCPLIWAGLLQLAGKKSYRGAFAFSIGLLAAAILLPRLGRWEWAPAWAATLLSLIAGGGFALIWLRRPAVSSSATLTSPAMLWP